MTTEVIDHPTSLTIASPLPVFGSVDMVNAFKAYQGLQRALDSSMPDQLLELDGKVFRKKGYWRAIAVAFNLTVEPTEERREVYGQLEDGSDNYCWITTYRATTPIGRSATGDGSCAAAEKQRGRMKASEHNVRSHAHTRAFNRAVSNLVGFGEVSAEEAEREDGETKPPISRPLERPDDGLYHVTKVVELSRGHSDKGEWKLYGVETKELGAGIYLSTLDGGVVKLAMQAKKDGAPVEIDFTEEKKGKFTQRHLSELRVIEERDPGQEG